MTNATAGDENRANRVRAFFKETAVRTSWPWRHWNAHPMVAAAINRRISGSPDRSFHHVLADLLPRFGLELPVGRAVSLGCGRGQQDRDLYRFGIVSALTGYDLSPDSVLAAEKWARSCGIRTFDYQCGNLDTITLDEGAYDLVVAEMSLHHTTHLERLYDQVARALRPGGLLVVDEYVGPTRFRWSDAQMRTVNGLLAILPDAMRKSPDGIFKPPIERQPETFFEDVDPSEAIRSGEVLALLKQRFDVLWQRSYGGTLLHPMLHDIACNFPDGDLYSETFLQAAITLEETMMATGDLQSDFAVLVARPK